MASTTTNIEDDIRALRNDIAALADSINHVVAGAGDAKAAAQSGLGNGLNNAKSAGRHFVSDAAKLQSDSVQAAGEAAGSATSALANEIRDKPFVAVAAALCVGFIAGMVQHR